MYFDRRTVYLKRILTLLLVALGYCGATAPCQATMLNLTTQPGPFIADITSSFATATYNSTTDLLTINGTALAIDYDRAAPIDSSVKSGGVGNPASFLVSAHIDGSGALIGPGTTTDLKIMGRIPNGPHPDPVYGTLLTGRAVAFGYANNSPHRIIEFVFQVTGGSQAPFFGPSVGLIFDTISGFSGTFASNFTTSVNGNGDTFAIPEPSSAVLAAIGCFALALVGWVRKRSQSCG